jgi:serine/threonine-protein kinase RsbW
MATPDPLTMTIVVPAEVRFFRSVRLAVGGLAAMVGFDVEAIEDLRIGVDELCAALAEGGSGADLHLAVQTEPGAMLRIDGTTSAGDAALDEDRFRFSRQILSVVADDFGYEAEGDRVRCWLERTVDAGADVT